MVQITLSWPVAQSLCVLDFYVFALQMRLMRTAMRIANNHR